MSFPQFSVAQLAEFSGRGLQDYTPYADQALLQATVIFMMVTQLTDMPIDPFEAQIATFGILAYADSIVLEQPYQQVVHNPFQSQTIGSTSYSKPVAYARGNAATNALKGEATGITWFDLAIQKLALRTEFGGVYGESIPMKMDSDVFIKCDQFTGEVHIVGPADRDRENMLFSLLEWNSDSPGGEGNGSGAGSVYS
jgi:hypothetical protein